MRERKPTVTPPVTDEFGYTSAAMAGLQVFEMSARGSGRTMRLIERVKKGDAIICASSGSARYIRSALRDMKKDGVEVLVRDPKHFPRDPPGTRPHGRAFYDHHFAYLVMEHGIRETARMLGYWQGAMSKTFPEHPDDWQPNPDERNESMMTRQARERGWL